MNNVPENPDINSLIKPPRKGTLGYSFTCPPEIPELSTPSRAMKIKCQDALFLRETERKRKDRAEHDRHREGPGAENEQYSYGWGTRRTPKHGLGREKVKTRELHDNVNENPRPDRGEILEGPDERWGKRSTKERILIAARTRSASQKRPPMGGRTARKGKRPITWKKGRTFNNRFRGKREKKLRSKRGKKKTVTLKLAGINELGESSHQVSHRRERRYGGEREKTAGGDQTFGRMGVRSPHFRHRKKRTFHAEGGRETEAQNQERLSGKMRATSKTRLEGLQKHLST